MIAPAHREEDTAVSARLRSARHTLWALRSTRPNRIRPANSRRYSEPSNSPDLGQRRGLRLRRVQPGAERLPDGPATTTGAAIRRNRPLMDNLMDKTVPPTIDKPSSPQTRDSLSPPNAHVRAVFGQQLQPVVHRRFAPRSVVRHGGTEGPFAV